MAQAKFRGRFVWQELMTEDTAAASAFYTKLLGWSAKDSGGDQAYTEFYAGSRGVGGMMQTPADAKAGGAKPMWMPYMSVDDADATVKEIEASGGKVVRPAQDIPEVGRFAVLKDPQGAVFAIIKPNGPPPAPNEPAPKPGEFSWLELGTTDLDAAIAFYSKIFGWEELQRHDMGPMGFYLIFGSDGVQRGGMFKMGAQHGPGPYWLPYAAVVNADTAAKDVTAAGGSIVNGPMDVPDGGRIVQILDPGGALFALHAQVTPKVEPLAKPAAVTTAAPATPKPKPKPKPKPPAKAAPPVPKPTAVPAAVVAPKTVAAPAAKTAPKKKAKKAPAKKAPAKKAPSKVAKKKVGPKAKKKVAAAKKSAPKTKKSKAKPKAKVKAKVKTKAKGKAKAKAKSKAKRKK